MPGAVAVWTGAAGAALGGGGVFNIPLSTAGGACVGESLTAGIMVCVIEFSVETGSETCDSVESEQEEKINAAMTNEGRIFFIGFVLKLQR